MAEIGKTSPRRGGVQTFVTPLYLEAVPSQEAFSRGPMSDIHVACEAEAEKAERVTVFLVLSIEGRLLATQFLATSSFPKILYNSFSTKNKECS
jgi:hypothetical protein